MHGLGSPQMTISVIIPIYHGNQYIDTLLNMLRENYINGEDYIGHLEAIFINDSPEEALQLPENLLFGSQCSVKVLQNDANRGIHYSRVRALKESTCDYIMFLDQDDRISPNYLRFMLRGLKDADAVICNGYDCGKIILRDVAEFENSIASKKYIDVGMALFPGQVVLKKACIPDEWLQNIILKNCSDDLFLWILMLHQNRKFHIIDEKLYCHVVSGYNKSDELKNRLESNHEVFAYLEEHGILSAGDVQEQYSDYHLSLSDDYLLTRLQNQIVTTRVYEGWMQNRDRGFLISNFLKREGYRKIAIYGFGDLGRHLAVELSQSDLELKCVMDRKKISNDLYPMKQFGEDIGDVDVMIVSLITGFPSIYNTVHAVYPCKIISLATCISCSIELD